jgi:hypothetical protein
MKTIKKYYSLPLFIMFHPFEGFYRMKFEKEGRMAVAIINFFLLWFSISFMRQYTSITAATPHPLSFNSLADGISIFAILVLWSASNWSVTSLMDGEGKFKEIFMGNCYAMMPLILVLAPAAALSNVFTDTESAFYFMLITGAVVWFIFLAYVGMVVVHDYTAGKALATVFLTFVALLIIVFLGTLIIAIIQQMYGFGRSIYTELAFR